MKTKTFLTLLLLVASTMIATHASAVAFKAENATDFTFRARVHDRGEWRPWVEMGPGFWDDIAKSVTRTTHDVQIDYWNGKQWRKFHRRNHGSKAWTRVIYFETTPNNQVQMTWWDERGGGCRDWPSKSNTCLKRSGGWGGLFDVIKEVGKIVIKFAGTTGD